MPWSPVCCGFISIKCTMLPFYFFLLRRAQGPCPDLDGICAAERQPCRTWADLPKELLAFIAEEVGPSLVRSVCRSWRDSVDTTRTVLSPAIFHPAQIVQRFPSLTHLDLSPCSITVSDDRLQQLQQLTNLQTLNLKGCAQLTPAGLKPLAQCSALQNIILGGELDSVPRTAFQGEKELNNKVLALQAGKMKHPCDRLIVTHSRLHAGMKMHQHSQ